jgi:hypothetical protein
MSAILELKETPRSCTECELSYSVGTNIICKVIKDSVWQHYNTRHPDCPLKITEKSINSDTCKNCSEEIDCLIKNGWDKCERFN